MKKRNQSQIAEFGHKHLGGDMKVKENKVDIDVIFDDIWDVLNVGAGIHIETKENDGGCYSIRYACLCQRIKI
ncbi:MAG: hypothetical protein ACYS67_10355 [Planctomycetota bacterium]